MNQERPQEDIPGTGGVEVLPRQDEDEDEGADEQGIGGTDDDEADDEDAEGGLPAL